MSHRATNWAIQQRGLKPAAKILLWNLADCHNPSHGCFPSQKYLAEHCEMSDRTVRRHLIELEDLGLITRGKVRAENGFDRTEYILNFDVFNDRPDKMSSGQNGYKPADKMSGTQRTKCPTNLVSNNPVKNRARKRDDKFYSFYADWINGDKVLPPSCISGEVASELVKLGYVSEQRMQERVG